MIPLSPQNRIMVQVDKLYQDEKETETGFKYYVDTGYNPEWHATATGKVVSVPAKLVNTDPGSIYDRIVPHVQVGDEIAFSYLVIEDKKIINDTESFMELTEPESRNKLFQNGLKETVTFTHLSKKEAVVIWAKDNGDFIAGFHGKIKEAVKWIKQFRYADDSNIAYANLLWVDEQDYWMVTYMEALAVKKESGEIKMLCGMVLMEEPEVREVYEVGPGRKMYVVAKVDRGKAKVVNIGDPLKGDPILNVKPGDYVRFNEKYAQKYELWGKKYLLIEQHRILGLHDN